MGVKKFIKKSVAFVAATAMALTMVVAPVGAGAGVSYAAEGTEDNLHLSKGIELQPDGNYKITLEAYSTGKDTTTTTDKAVPLDIVLVLDQSGSMEDGFTSSESTYTKILSKDEDEYKEVYESKDKELYVLDSGEYYQISVSRTDQKPKQYTISYVKNGQTKYIANNEKNAKLSVDIFECSKSTSRLNALKSAVTNFVNSVEQNAIGDPKTTEDDVDHRIAIVGFASESGYGDNTEILSVSGNNSGNVGVKYSDSFFNYNYTNATKTAFQDTTTDAGKNMLNNAINALAANGATRTDLGMEMAKDILSNNPKKDEVGRKKLVIMFTDGTPTTKRDFSTSVANDAILNAKAIKNAGANVYSIGIFDGADPNGTSNENKFMNYVSSNYPDAKAMNTTGNKIEKPIYYKTASNAGQLSDVFESIQHSETTSEATVPLTSKSILRDVISKNFELPKGAEASSVKVYTADSDQVSDNSISWKNRVPDTTKKYQVSINDKKVDVTGFDYSDKFVTANHPGQKLIVEILVNGLQSGIDMDSNDTKEEKSGIYENSSATTAIKNFTSPKVDIPEYSYVLDYGKKVVLPNVDSNTKNIYDTRTKDYKNILKINSTAAPTTDKSISKKYGTFAIENATVDANDTVSNKLTYQPSRINWDGFDSIFTFAEKTDSTATDDTNSKYEWYKTNVIPATSVYYEDDFAQTENPAEGEDESNIKIVYDGDWTVISGSGQNSQSSQNTVYGWEDSYKNDTNFSNGSVRYTDDINATATFTFRGTGVDVYSKTDGDVGMICAQIYREGSNKAMKTLYIDGLSVSGKSDNEDTPNKSATYYQIPTLSFDGLDYGKYKVVIYAGGQGTGGGTTYYLDGIRVYNPLGITDEEIGNTAKNAYVNAGEYNATYKEVRDLLLKSGSFNVEDKAKGIVFIDKFDKTVGATTDDIKTFEDYGPKNEVYLSEEQSIAFEIQSGYENLFIGAKSPTGKPITMTVSDKNKNGAKNITFSHASDMYYKIDPPVSTTSGKNVVVITNNSSNLLSLTKIRATGEGYNMNIDYTPALMSYVNEFISLEPAETDEKGMIIETPNTDVDVDNPSDGKDNQQEASNNFWQKVLNELKNWFRR